MGGFLLNPVMHRVWTTESRLNFGNRMGHILDILDIESFPSL